MPDLLRRAAALTVLSAVGIALLAPVAARSVAPVSINAIDHLITAPAAAPAGAERGTLSVRELSATIPEPPAAPEGLAAHPFPTPNTALMQATLRSNARPPAAPAAPGAPAAPVDMGSVWDRLAQCESGGNWAINTGNGYYGGLQFNYSTWLSYGGGEFAEYAHLATREQQIAIAERLHAKRGFQPWPGCRAKLGLP